MTSNKKDGTVLQCGLPALSMLLACNSDVMSCRNCMVIMPLRPSSPFNAARSSKSDIDFTFSTLSRIGIMRDRLLSISVWDNFGIESSNVELTGSALLRSPG